MHEVVGYSQVPPFGADVMEPSALPDNELDLEKLFCLPGRRNWLPRNITPTYEGGEGRADRREGRKVHASPAAMALPEIVLVAIVRPAGGRRTGAVVAQQPVVMVVTAAGSSGEGRRDFDRGQQPRERRETPPPLPEVNVAHA